MSRIQKQKMTQTEIEHELSEQVAAKASNAATNLIYSNIGKAMEVLKDSGEVQITVQLDVSGYHPIPTTVEASFKGVKKTTWKDDLDEIKIDLDQPNLPNIDEKDEKTEQEAEQEAEQEETPTVRMLGPGQPSMLTGEIIDAEIIPDSVLQSPFPATISAMDDGTEVVATCKYVDSEERFVFYGEGLFDAGWDVCHMAKNETPGELLSKVADRREEYIILSLVEDNKVTKWELYYRLKNETPCEETETNSETETEAPVAEPVTSTPATKRGRKKDTAKTTGEF